MAVTAVGGNYAQTLQSIAEMRNQLDDLQRQLGTGKKAETYSGLGLNRGLTVGLRSQLSAISGYQESITQVAVRLNLMQTALSHFDSVAHQAKSAIQQSQYVLHGTTQTQDQSNARGILDSFVGMLNTAADGRYLFSGRTVNQAPLETANHILEGDGLRAGLKQMIGERKQADLGAGGLGRLVIGAPTATSVSVAEDAVSPFGFKLVGATTNIGGATVSPPGGSPPIMSVDVSAAVPIDGDIVKFTFMLPDGTSRDLTLTATASATPAPGQFTIGAMPANTAANLQAALAQGLGALAETELVAASAVAAGNDFFDTDASHPPQRVDGPPFDTATAMVDGTAADTVAWYTGDNGADDPRSSALVRADQSLTVSYGARANEHAFRVTLQSLAVFAATQFSGSDPSGEAQYKALRQRIGAALVGTDNEQKISDIAGQLAGAQVALNSAKDRHNQTNTTLQNLLQSVEGAPTEQVAAQLLSLQTSLQATLQTTAMLLQTNILKYL